MRCSLFLLLIWSCFDPIRAQEPSADDEQLMIILEDSLLIAQFDTAMRGDEVKMANLMARLTQVSERVRPSLPFGMRTWLAITIPAINIERYDRLCADYHAQSSVAIDDKLTSSLKESLQESQAAYDSGDLKTAERTALRLHDLWEAGEIPNDTIAIQLNKLLGSVYLSLANYDKAEGFLLKAKLVEERAQIRIDDGLKADILCLLGYTYLLSGNRETAALMADGAANILARLDTCPAELSHNISFLYEQIGVTPISYGLTDRWVGAEVAIDDAASRLNRFINDVSAKFLLCSEWDREEMWNNYASWFNDLKAELLNRHEDNLLPLLKASVFEKQILLNGSRKARLRASQSVEISCKREQNAEPGSSVMPSAAEIIQMSADMARLQSMQREALRKPPLLRERHDGDMERLEKHILLSLHADTADYSASLDAKISDAIASVESGSALVEFFTVDAVIYGIVIDDNHELRLTRICPEAELHALLSDKDINRIYHSRQGYDFVWSRLGLDSIRTIIYSPVGDVWKLAMNAVTDADDSPLMDSHQLHIVSSILTTEAGNDRIADILVFDDIDTRAELGVWDAGLERSIQQLPRLKSFHSPDDLSPLRSVFLTGREASEEAFYKAAPGREAIHFTAHGFFLETGSYHDRMTQGLPYNPLFNQPAMHRTGLLLAGSDKAWSGYYDYGEQEDGMLRAEEIALTDLSGVKLVVLSGCSTAEGDAMGAEGIYGLQRAFKLAGAESMVMTLWNVDDEAARTFEKAFYTALGQSLTVREAYAIAIERLRLSFSQPYMWAPFVLIE